SHRQGALGKKIASGQTQLKFLSLHSLHLHLHLIESRLISFLALMEHTNKDQPEISRDVSRPSSKTIAMALPKILHKVFSFLDQNTLESCLRVSRFWYTHGQTLAWQTLSIDIVLFSRLAYDIPAVEADKNKDQNEQEKDNNKDKLQDFIENCHHIRSLTLTSPKACEWRIPDLPDSLNPRVAGLKNLNHFAVKSEQTPQDISQLYRLAGAILSQNPGIQEIGWQQNQEFNGNDFTDLILQRVVGERLKKISIDSYFRDSGMLFLQDLADANKQRKERPEQEQAQQEGVRMTTQGELMDESIKDETESKNESNSSGGDHGFELEELVLRDYLQRSRVYWDWLYNSYVHSLPIRSLSFVNFEPFDRVPSQGDGLGNSILPILCRCPDLEKLCVSFDRHPNIPDNSTTSFLNNLAKNPHYSRQPSTNRMRKENKRFVESMYKHCPKLREIEFGMFYQLTSNHWIEMMEMYGPQLEHLSVWGNITAFNSEAFMTLIGPPVDHLSGNRLHTLTRLNINGMKHLHECAFMALFLLPHLKEFRARDVPLDAKSLIEEEWICQGLELLEIFVVIPRRTRWQWVGGYGWRSGFERYQYMWDDSSNNDTDDDEMSKTLKRQVRYLSTEKPRKKASEDLMKYINTQVNVCKALGRLTQLRELRIEGVRHFEFGKRDWGCLELTLETGLEHLAPLQHGLERLIVSELDEAIGRKEVEWIARNWVHHNNSRWLEQYHTSSQGMEASEGSRAVGARPDDDASFDTRSKLKALIGVSGRVDDAIKWLREQCPTLSVIEVE
ncbi:MAG: hypothetical protein J3Q66DRAFT_6287, partial [Benniella sp.]